MPAPEHSQSFRANSVIFREGDIGDCAYIIERGTVDVRVLRDGQQVHLATLSRGDLFGELALISEDPRSATVIAREDADFIVIDRRSFQNKISLADPMVGLFLRTLLSRFHETRERLLSCVQPREQCDVVTPRYDSYYERDRAETVREIAFEDALSEALKQNEFQVLYQPIVDLDNNQTAGFEALVRWRHPTRGLVSPDQFIRFAENSGQIVAIGSWVFEQACQAQKSFQSQWGDTSPFISINLSVRQFAQPDLVESFGSLIDKWNADPECLKLEITESLLLDNPLLAGEILHGFKKLGVKIAIDDFGTGYSSFSYLVRFPFDSLKIDQSFVASVISDARSRTVIQSLATLAHSLGLTVIAEGVETDEQAVLIHDMGCEYGQGTGFAEPLPITDAFRFSQARRYQVSSE